MRQAYQEIAEPVIQRTEQERMKALDDLVDYTHDHSSGSLFITSLNELMEDVINALEDKYIDESETEVSRTGGKAYPYTRAYRKIEKAGIDEFRELVYRYEKAKQWDALWRDAIGRVSKSWWNAAESLIDKLEIDRGNIDHYTEVQSAFK